VSNSLTPSALDTIPPQVSIDSPLDGARVARNHNLTIQAQATDSTSVSKVEFYVDGVLKCTDTVSEGTNLYKCVWRVPKRTGVTYRLQVIAYDTSNNFSSTAVSVISK